MPKRIGQETYYYIGEVAELVGRSPSTIRRWIREGRIERPLRRDSRGRLLFSKEEKSEIQEFAHTRLGVRTGGKRNPRFRSREALNCCPPNRRRETGGGGPRKR